MSNPPNGKTYKQIVAEEYKKCAQDPVHFMKKYCKIQHPIKGKILFQLYPFQEKTLAEFKKHDRNIVLKSRQMGISTLVAGYSLWLMTFHSDKNILVIATKQEVAKNLVTKVREMHEALPPWMRGVCTENNRLSMRFKNGSQIKAESSAPDAARSLALSLLVIDEAAFITIADEIWTGAASTLSTGGKAIILSTPNGIGNFFHKKWLEAEQGVLDDQGRGFNPINLKWDLHPERTKVWRDAQDDLLGPKKASQECDCEFLTSGNTVVDSKILLEYQLLITEPIERRGPGGDLWIWERRDRKNNYIVSADVARGDGSDFSTFEILNVETMEQVGEFRSKIDTKEFGDFLVDIATEYNDALLIVENSSIGWAVIQQIVDRQYKNMFYSTEDLQVIDVAHKINNKLNGADRRAVPGFTNSHKTRPLVISKLDLYMREKSCILHSKRLNDELFTFIWNNGRAEAMEGYNDDIVMAFAIGLWVRDTALRLRTEGMEVTRMAINGIHKSTLPTTPFYTATRQPVKNPWSMQIGNQEEDLKWLL